MAITLDALVGNSVYSLDGFDPYIHFGNDGFGLPPVTNYMQSGPLQNGATFTDFRLDNRIVTLLLGLSAGDSTTYLAQRRKLWNIFKPKAQPIKLRLTDSDTGDVRQLDTFYKDGGSANSQDKDGYFHRFAIQLDAPDPTWYDPNGISVQFGTVSASGFSIPMSIPLSVGRSTINQTVSISYTGTWDSYPIITIVGPVTDCVITNETTGDVLDFTGTTINSGTTYTIDTRYGYKTVVDQTGANKIAQLIDSDLSTFRLVAADDDSGVQVNDISVTGTGATSVSRIFVAYFNRYIGV